MVLRTAVSDPSNPFQQEKNHFQDPELVEYHPNAVILNQYPNDGLKICHQIIVSSSNQISGRLTFLNIGSSIQDFKFSILAELTPDEMGEPMQPGQIEMTNILHGKTANLEPVLFFTGGPESSISPHTSLSHLIYLRPGEKRSLTWVLASCETQAESYQQARITASRNWEALLARIRMSGKEHLILQTSNPEWNKVLEYQRHVLRTLPIENKPTEAGLTFFKTRLPDQGYSFRGDGSDYSQPWAVQTMLDTWYLEELLLPSRPGLIKTMLENLLHNRHHNNRLPGWLSYQRRKTSTHPTPLVCSLLWKYFRITADHELLAEYFPVLLENLEQWLEKTPPTWETLQQSGFLSNPLFARWAEFGQGLDINKVIAPDLLAYLYNEIQHLILISEELNRLGSIEKLQTWAENLKETLDASWDYRAATFRYLDPETYASSKSQLLGNFTGTGTFSIQTQPKIPSRILVRLENTGESALMPDISIHGKNTDGESITENFLRKDFQWFGSYCILTTKKVFSELETISLERISLRNTTIVRVPDLKVFDHTQFVPLWAGMADPKKADSIIRKTILSEKRFFRKYGIPALYKGDDPPENQAIWIPWNIMVVKGLVQYGYLEEAFELYSRLMDASLGQLNQHGYLSRYTNSSSGEAFGEQNHLHSLLPESLLLEICGIYIRTPFEVEIRDYNCWLDNAEVFFRGLKIQLKKDRILVNFPGGMEHILETPIKNQIIQFKKTD